MSLEHRDPISSPTLKSGVRNYFSLDVTFHDFYITKVGTKGGKILGRTIDNISPNCYLLLLLIAHFKLNNGAPFNFLVKRLNEWFETKKNERK